MRFASVILTVSILKLISSSLLFKIQDHKINLNFKFIDTEIISKVMSDVNYLCLYKDDNYKNREILGYLFSTYCVIHGKDISDKSDCNGYLFLQRNSEETISFLRRIRFTFRDTVLIFAEKHTEILLHNDNVFGNGNVLIVENMSKLYTLSSWPHSAREFRGVETLGSVMVLHNRNVFEDMKGRLLNVSSFNCPPFVYIDEGSYDGIEMAIFKEISQRLNFTWVLHQPPDDNRYGWIERTRTWSGGLIGSLAQGTTDVSFCSLWVVQEQLKVMEVTTPWKQMCVTFLVPRPVLAPRSLGAIFLPFETTLWLTFIAAQIATATVLWILAHAHSTILPSKPNRYLRLQTGLLDMLGMLVVTATPQVDRRRSPARHVVSWWSVLSLLAVTAYSSGLVSYLTLPHYSNRIESVRDMVEAGMYWGVNYAVATKDIFDMQNPWHSHFSSRFRLETSKTDRTRRLGSRKYAILGQEIDGKIFYQGYQIKSNDLMSLCVMKECVTRVYASLALQKSSPLTAPFNKIIMRLFQTGIIDYWQRDVIRRRTNFKLMSAIQGVGKELGTKTPQTLALNNLSGAFVLFGLGHLFSICVFGMETMIWRRAENCRVIVKTNLKHETLEKPHHDKVGMVQVERETRQPNKNKKTEKKNIAHLGKL